MLLRLLPFVLLLAAGAATAASPANQYVWTGSTWVPMSGSSGGSVIVSGGTLAAATTNGAGTIATGGTFQQIAASNASRQTLTFQNLCNLSGKCSATTDFCYLYIAASGSPSTAKSIAVGPGQMYSRTSGVVPSDSIQATCDGNNDTFYLDTQ